MVNFQLEIRETFPLEEENSTALGCEFESSTLRSELRLRVGESISEFFAKNAPPENSSETLSSSSLSDCAADEIDYDAIFEPRKLDGLDPIERELECKSFSKRFISHFNTSGDPSENFIFLTRLRELTAFVRIFLNV